MVRSGLDILLTKRRSLIRGKRAGLVVNHTAVDASLVHIIDHFIASDDLKPHRLFGPEHGIWGAAQDMEAVDSGRDAHSGLPLVSLYGHDEASLLPSEDALRDLEVIVFDIQDIGARYYTFAYTLAFVMEAAGRAGIPVIVCGRPNPISGEHIEGNRLDMAYRSFVGRFPLPMRHGMTLGELAYYFQRAHGISCELEVIPMDGWRRSFFFDQTGLPWVQPSPNMPTPETALIYPGLCLIEGTNLSEGRGTTRPFHLVGAPFFRPHAAAKALNALNVPGARWRPTYFTPMFQKHRGQVCGGVELHVIDRDAFHAVHAGLALLHVAHRLHPNTFAWRTDAYEFVSDRLAIDLLGGGPALRRSIEEDVAPAEILRAWEPQARAFERERRGYLLYE